MTKATPTIPTLKPFQFDTYLFNAWVAPVGSWYDDFHITKIEVYRNHLKLPIPPHRRSVNYFFFLTKGTAIRSKFLTNHEITPGHFFFLPADITSSFEYLSPDAEGYYCHFKMSALKNSIPKMEIPLTHPFSRLDADPLVKVDQPERILNLLTILENEYQKNDRTRFPLVALYLSTLFFELGLSSTGSDLTPAAKNAAVTLTMQYKNALSAFIYSKTTVSDYAEYLKVTTNHLNKCVKTITGKSAQTLLFEMQILEAKVLLSQSNLSIGDIAFKLGKADQSSFTRFFKANTNISPKKYRINNGIS